MKRITVKKRAKMFYLVLLLFLAFALTACSEAEEDSTADYNEVSAENLSETVQPADIAVDESQKENGDKAVRNFGVNLLRETLAAEQDKNKNLLVSPLSAVFALAMTENGADGETLAQMENVLGLPAADMNAYLHYYNDKLRTGDNFNLTIANSIWFKETAVDVAPSFLQTNADYYKADIFKAPFDQSTADDINNWVSRKTNGRIDNMVDEISEYTIMYLINALALDATWYEVYEQDQVEKDIFTTADKKEQNVDFMCSEEEYYLEDNTSVGFMKYYASGTRYAFVALLPNEGVSVEDYIHSMTGDKLQSLLENSRYCVVNTKMPKFEVEYEIVLNDVLRKMGMVMPFDDSDADFSRMGKSKSGNNVYISEVLQKTYMSVDEKGTKAAAATSVEMNEAADISEDPTEIKQVYLDRPFVYMIIDCNHNIPIFAGTMMSVE